MTPCPQCYSANSSYKLGKLGDTTHYRCRNCGFVFSHTPPPQVVRAAEKAAPRRFNDEPLTGFGDV